jgi:hypothetical protein
MAVCPVTLQRMQELNTGLTAAILRDQAGNEPPVSYVEKAALPPLGSAIPTQTRSLPGTSHRVECQADTFSGGQLASQPALLADSEAPPVTTSAAINSPWHDVNTRMPHPESFKAWDSVGDLPSQSTDPDPEDEDFSDDSSTVNSTSHWQTRKWKKRKWHQRILDRVLRRGSSQLVNVSMPNLLSYGVSQ